MSSTNRRSSDEDALYGLAPMPERRHHPRPTVQFEDEVPASSPLPSHIKSTGLAAIAVLLIGLPIWSYVSARMEASRMKEDAALAEAAARDQTQENFSEASREVEAAIAKRDFSGAQFILEIAVQKGLPGRGYTELNSLISKRAFEERARRVAEVESLRRRGELDAALTVMREVRALDRYTVYDEARTSCERLLNESIDAAHEKRASAEAAREEGRASAMLDSSKAAARTREWDQALRRLEDARLEYGDSAEVINWQNTLQDKIGGRLKIDSNVARFKILIDGAPVEPEKGVVVGLPEGEIEVTIEAENFVPELRKFNVSFPIVTTGFVELVPEAPGAAWAASILADPCANWLLRAYYLSIQKNDTPGHPLDGSIQPCATESKSHPSSDELRKRVMYRLMRAQDPEKPLRTRLGDLGELIAKHPESTAMLLDDPGFRSLLGDIAPQLEHACADCLGSGVRICAACDGRGRRRELRPCDSCNSTGYKIHKICHGSGYQDCKVCKGHGSIPQTRRDCRGGLYPVRVVCSACVGRRRQDCGGCVRGRVVCKACNGNRMQDRMGGCSSCRGMSGWPCTTCGRTGLRTRMEPARRRKQEHAATRLVAGH